MENFPTLSIKHDSTKYSESRVEGGTVSKQMEGGYNFTRKRYTRKPARSFKIGFTLLTEADRIALVAHFDRVGSHTEFQWKHPTTAEVIYCRYTEKETFSFKYDGTGGNHRWSIELQLEET